MLVNRNRNDCACELTLTIWNRNLQLCSGSNPPPSSAPCKTCPEHLPRRLTTPYTFSPQESTLSPKQPPHHPPLRDQTPLGSPQAVLSLHTFARALPHSCVPAASQTKHQLFLVCSADVSRPLHPPLSQPFSDWSQVTPPVFVLPKSTDSARGQQVHHTFPQRSPEAAVPAQLPAPFVQVGRN